MRQSTVEDRYDRQRRIRNWDQAALSRSRVLLVGAGALGNEILKNLALLGVGHILVVDFDHIERSNLGRTVLFRETDNRRSKAETAVRAAREMNPEIDVQAMHGDVFYDLGAGFYRRADLVISGLDNVAARAKVAASAYLTETPFLDSGLWSLGGEVRCFLPNKSFCFDCTLGETDRQEAHVRRSCTGFRVPDDTDAAPAATNVATVAIIAGLACQEAVKLLSGQPALESGDALVYNGLQMRLAQSRLPGNDRCACRLGRPYRPVIESRFSASTATAAELLEFAAVYFDGPGTLELGRDLLIGFREGECREATCGFDEAALMLQPLAKIDESVRVCQACGVHRTPVTASRVRADSPWSRFTLEKLGVAPGEILALWHAGQAVFVELSGDLPIYWPQSTRIER